MSTILLLGVTGQVGHELKQTLAPLGKLITPSRSQLNLAQPDSIRSALLEANPDIIVNAAGFTVVDAAEAQPELAMQVNGIAPGIIAETAKSMGALLVHYSTTFVWDGTQRTPYREDDPPNPINAYGRSKLIGDHAIAASGCDHIILRASWTYSGRRTNFVLKLLELARETPLLNVVDDQIAAPTWAREYARATAQMLKSPAHLRSHRGLYNLTAQGSCTRYQWAQHIIATARKHMRDHHAWAQLHAITTQAYADPALRPLYTVADNSKIREWLGVELPPWDVSLSDFMCEHLGA
ncbi:MAG: dTDP-4-dehydrorhamnose reductase [Betaproteobacteria bacterium]|nr:dTDP-4-dehydrorhamnose reductase [Betaproteobacteria bacterium]